MQENGAESLFGSPAKNPEQNNRLQREIEGTDRQIDQLVYELYGLAEEEIRIVEEKAGYSVVNLNYGSNVLR